MKTTSKINTDLDKLKQLSWEELKEGIYIPIGYKNFRIVVLENSKLSSRIVVNGNETVDIACAKVWDLCKFIETQEEIIISLDNH